MVINLKNKIKSPISISCLVVLVGIIAYAILSHTYVIDYTAQNAYLKSDTFMKTMGHLTAYLKQAKIESDDLYYKKYEDLDNLKYYIETADKRYSNHGITKEELNALKRDSRFYIHIAFNDAYNYSIDGSFGQETSYAPYWSFRESFDRIIREGALGRANQKLGYENLDVYYFITKDKLTPTDFVYSNIEKYKLGACFKVLIIIYAILSLCFVMGMAIGCYKDEFKGKGWEWFRHLSIEVKVILGIIVYWKIRSVYWMFRQPNALIRLASRDVMTKGYYAVLFGIGSIALLCIIAWYMVDIAYLLRNNGWKVIKEKTLLRKYKQSILGCVYRLIGIDIRKAIYLKLIVFNMIHIGALVFMELMAWRDGQDALIIGFIYTVLWFMGAVGFIMDFRMLKNQVKRINKEKDVEEKDNISQSFKSPYIKIFTGLVVYAISLFVLVITAYESQFLGFIMAIGIGSVITGWSMRWARSYQELYLYVVDIRERRKGQVPARSFLSPITHELSKIDEGFQNAVNQELVSQRMKTELISNVSHDLKTPLTSIINYVDLLKNKDLTQGQKEEYVSILDQKSQRLKVLIEDLFEASKAASGNIELVSEKIDLIALLKQTLGELAEKISTSGLQFKVNLPEEKVICELDGRRTYRIFENLMGNILKYAAPHSRVYIDCILEEEVRITFRNISAYEMNFTAEEIMERFKRGDESRNTEGSGLGLSIAKNLTELQGGKFEVYVDGDLFKVTLRWNRV